MMEAHIESRSALRRSGARVGIVPRGAVGGLFRRYLAARPKRYYWNCSAKSPGNLLMATRYI